MALMREDFDAIRKIAQGVVKKDFTTLPAQVIEVSYFLNDDGLEGYRVALAGYVTDKLIHQVQTACAAEGYADVAVLRSLHW